MTETGNSLLIAATRALTEAGVPDAARDARRLLSFAVGVEAGRLTLVLPEPVEPDAQAKFRDLIARRVNRQPVSQLIGKRAFYGRDYLVTADVLDPRPETEILVEAALAQPFGHVLDLGTGSGCILLTLLAEMADSRGVGVDISPVAVQVAQTNAQTLELSHRARFMVSDWAAEVEGVFDLVVSNPPYISTREMAELAPEVRDWEPRMALTDESDGLAAYRAIFGSIGPYLAESGRVVVEIGPDQAQDVSQIAQKHGFETLAVIRDLDGRDRVIVAQWIEIPF
ncbi:peptide chain release factor N(5)-glutamine methyltransferase [Flavimaricola marinus]|uniref:Release factor glutamine methyltransferase n=1 Tax=Flavimaricola marinus TaxID=1819565 RepID=A0A238LJP8_9RHOB|nr:peptide chain release factor N(5)-glutamine methyltransferase [Flavimaricola marinus]SMY09624.1 Release factor glutamine methyltransferase [Flavimaricola marinus]